MAIPSDAVSFLGHYEDRNRSSSTLDGLVKDFHEIPQVAQKRHGVGWTRLLFSILQMLGNVAALTTMLVVLHQSYAFSTPIAMTPSSTSVASSADSTHEWKTCGNTVQEALSSNCRYDVILGTWYHEDCYDEELLNTYVARYGLTWYAESGLLQPIPRENVSLGLRETWYANRDYHYMHCGYTWEMIIRALAAGRPIVKEISTFGHTEHCTEILVSHDKLHRNETKVDVAYHSCGFPW